MLALVLDGRGALRSRQWFWEQPVTLSVRLFCWLACRLVSGSERTPLLVRVDRGRGRQAPGPPDDGLFARLVEAGHFDHRRAFPVDRQTVAHLPEAVGPGTAADSQQIAVAAVWTGPPGVPHTTTPPEAAILVPADFVQPYQSLMVKYSYAKGLQVFTPL